MLVFFLTFFSSFSAKILQFNAFEEKLVKRNN